MLTPLVAVIADHFYFGGASFRRRAVRQLEEEQRAFFQDFDRSGGLHAEDSFIWASE
jgi:hypothetical protein